MYNGVRYPSLHFSSSVSYIEGGCAVQGSIQCTLAKESQQFVMVGHIFCLILAQCTWKDLRSETGNFNQEIPTSVVVSNAATDMQGSNLKSEPGD